jgi:SET domain-containing protein
MNMDLRFETELLVFKPSSIHGLGAFAKNDFAKGVRLIEYVGEKIDQWESLRRCEKNNEYIFALNQDEHLDGNVPRNLARFINHSCDPNCEPILETGKIWIVALCDMKAGEEITFNYSFDLEDYKQHPCDCGSPNCVGYIVAEEFFEHVRSQRELQQAAYNSTEQSP